MYILGLFRSTYGFLDWSNAEIFVFRSSFCSIFDSCIVHKDALHKRRLFSFSSTCGSGQC